MGAINQAFNQAAGSVAAAATLVKGAKEQDMSQALLGKEQSHEADAAIKELQDQMSGVKKQWGDAEAELEILGAKRPGGKGNTKASIDEKKIAKMTEIDAARKAFEELSDRVKAKQAMKQRAELMIRKADKWGGIR